VKEREESGKNGGSEIIKNMSWELHTAASIKMQFIGPRTLCIKRIQLPGIKSFYFLSRVRASKIYVVRNLCKSIKIRDVFLCDWRQKISLFFLFFLRGGVFRCGAQNPFIISAQKVVLHTL